MTKQNNINDDIRSFYPSDIEIIQGHGVFKVFYCDPSHLEQRDGCEKNHEEFWKVISQGKSFDDVSQDTIDIISNNINTLCRKKQMTKHLFHHKK